MRTLRTGLLMPVTLAWIALVGGACTTTYTQAQLDVDEPIAEGVPAEPLCTGLDGEAGCEMENPTCTDPSDFGCLPVDD